MLPLLGLRNAPLPSNVCWSMINNEWISTSSPKLAPSDELCSTLVVLLELFRALVLALGLLGTKLDDPDCSLISVRVVMTPNVCEASWYAIRWGDSPSGTVRMWSFWISSMVPIIRVVSMARAKLQKFWIEFIHQHFTEFDNWTEMPTNFNASIHMASLFSLSSFPMTAIVLCPTKLWRGKYHSYLFAVTDLEENTTFQRFMIVSHALY